MKESTKKKLRSFVEARGTAPDRSLTDMVDILTQEMIGIAAKKEKLQEELETIQEKIDDLETAWKLSAVGAYGEKSDFVVAVNADGPFVRFARGDLGSSSFKSITTPSDLLAVLKGFKITNWDRQY